MNAITEIALLRQELSALCGERVSFLRIAGDTIILYFNGEPGDDHVTTIRIDPPWRYENTGRVIFGSGDFPEYESDFATKEEYDAAFEAACDKTAELSDAILVTAEISDVGNDLVLAFEPSQILRSFSKRTTDGCWHFKNRKSNVFIDVNAVIAEAHTSET